MIENNNTLSHSQLRQWKEFYTTRISSLAVMLDDAVCNNHDSVYSLLKEIDGCKRKLRML